MAVVLPLDEMSIAEKIQVLEQVWGNLCQLEEDVPSPAWHGEILQAREQLVADNKARFMGWSEAKRSIREAINEN